MKKITPKLFNDDDLVNDLLCVIENYQKELFILANSGLVTLFWEIGKEINTKVKKLESNKNLKFFRVVSYKLKELYGPYFQVNSLKSMSDFATQYPDYLMVTKIAPTVTWEHLKLLLPLKNLQLQLFHIRIVFEQGLSVNQLRERLKKDSMPRQKSALSNKQSANIPIQYLSRTNSIDEQVMQNLKLALESQLISKELIRNLFKKPVKKRFYQLMTSSENLSKQTKKSKQTPDDDDEIKLLDILTEIIVKFQRQQNGCLNNTLNKCFWHIGNKINEKNNLRENQNINRDDIFKKTSKELRKNISFKYTFKTLKEMADFADQFKEFREHPSFINYLGWDYIRLLLSLNNAGAQLFYAELVLVHGLSLADLQKQIAQKAFEEPSRAKETESKTTVFKKPVIKKTSQTKGNVTVIITTRTIDLDDKINNNFNYSNIFRNHYLSLLISDHTLQL